MSKGTIDCYGSVNGRDPPADHSVVEIIAGISASCVEGCPARRPVGQLPAALPSVAREVRKWGKASHSTSRNVHLTPTILPRADRLGRTLRADSFRLINKVHCRLNFFIRRLARK